MLYPSRRRVPRYTPETKSTLSVLPDYWTRWAVQDDPNCDSNEVNDTDCKQYVGAVCNGVGPIVEHFDSSSFVSFVGLTQNNSLSMRLRPYLTPKQRKSHNGISLYPNQGHINDPYPPIVSKKLSIPALALAPSAPSFCPTMRVSTSATRNSHHSSNSSMSATPSRKQSSSTRTYPSSGSTAPAHSSPPTQVSFLHLFLLTDHIRAFHALYISKMREKSYWTMTKNSNLPHLLRRVLLWHGPQRHQPDADPDAAKLHKDQLPTPARGRRLAQHRRPLLEVRRSGPRKDL